MKNVIVLFSICCLLVSCNNNKVEPKASYFEQTGMDLSVNPADDFFNYCNGTWVKNAHIPEDLSRWGSFDSLKQDNIKKLKTILEEASAKTNLTKGSLEQQAGDYYASGLDTATMEKVGYTPLKPFLAKLEAVKNYTELIDLLADETKEGNGDLIGWSVQADPRNSTVNILHLRQTGLSLPEKNYYTKTDTITENQRTQLVNHAAKYFLLAGYPLDRANKDAKDVLMLETAIAKSHLLPAELRDPVRNYHKMSVADLQKLAPNINWKNTLTKMGLMVDSLDVAQPDYYKQLSGLLASQPIGAWKSKVRYDYIANNADDLSKVFRDEDFSFRRLFSGEKAQKERWKIMVESSDQLLRDVVSRLYVQKHFPPEAKKRMDELVNNLQKSFETHINKLDWMSDSTKQQARVKLATIMKKIGYPDKWKSFADVEINRNDFFANQRSLSKHFYKEFAGKLGKPVDKTEWGMTSPTVNAYYNPSYNEIVFPAGILQFPFFELGADDAINYGAIGVVIGHEITHGFDDEGRQYDEKGNLKDWWTAKDAELFKAKAEKLAAQFDQYTVLDSLQVNGHLTLGENIADLGGVNISYDAFKMTAQGKDTTRIDGFTPDQRFFLGFAQVWRGKMRPEYARTFITTNPHSPYKYRVDGPLSNFEPFYKAFGVTDKNKMYRAPEDRVTIW